MLGLFTRAVFGEQDIQEMEWAAASPDFTYAEHM
jgi:hypothetical protein